MIQLKIPSEQGIREAYRKGEDAVVELFYEVLSCIKDLSRHIEKLSMDIRNDPFSDIKSDPLFDF